MNENESMTPGETGETEKRQEIVDTLQALEEKTPNQQEEPSESKLIEMRQLHDKPTE